MKQYCTEKAFKTEEKISENYITDIKNHSNQLWVVTADFTNLPPLNYPAQLDMVTGEHRKSQCRAGWLSPLLEKAHVGTVSYRPKYTLALVGFLGSKESMEKVARAGSALCMYTWLYFLLGSAHKGQQCFSKAVILGGHTLLT